MELKNVKIGTIFLVKKVIDECGDESLIGHIGKVVEESREKPEGTIPLAFENGKKDCFYPEELMLVLPD